MVLVQLIRWEVYGMEPSRSHARQIPGDRSDIAQKPEPTRDVNQRQELEERFRFQAQLLDAVGQAIVAIDLQGKVLYWNSGAEQLYGWSEQQVVGRKLREFLISEDLWESADEIMSELRAGRSWSGEFPVRHKEGTTFLVEVTDTPVVDNQGNVVGIIGVSTNITERKRAEARLRESERRLSMLLSNAPAYLYRCRNEPGWPNEFVSDYAFELTGYTPEELTDGTIMYGDLIVEEDQQRVWDKVQAALERRERFELRYAIRCRDGEIKHVEERGQGLYSENGDVIAIKGVVYDVTDRKRAEEALRKSEERYRLVARATNEAIWDSDLISDTQTWDGAVETLFGYPVRQETNSAWWEERIHPEDRERVLAGIDAVLHSGEEMWSEEYRFRRADGTYAVVVDRAYVARDKEGGPARMIGSMMDITERKRAEESLKKAEERYRTLIEQIPVVVYTQRPDEPSRTTYVSPQNKTILGYTPDECLADPDHWIRIMHPDDRERVLAEDEHTNESGKPFVMEYRQFAKDDRVVWIRDEATMVRDENGEPLYWLGVQTDITERKEAEERLQASEAELRALFAAMDDVVFEIDAQGRYLKVAPTNPSLLYRPREELIGKTLDDVLPAKTAEELLGHIRRSMESRETVKAEYSLLIDGRETWFQGTITPLSEQSVVIVGSDITERKALEERLAHQALHDPLTDLPNRVLFTDRLRQAMARAERRKQPLTVMFMDLDNFKVINDSLGHNMGDRLLVTASKRIRTLLRPEDTVARLGGDEFVFLLEGTDFDDAARVAERILEELRVPFSFGGRELFVTASIGIAVGGGGKHPADLLRDADLAMYRAKHSGKARYAVFEEAMNAQALERLELEHGLRRAVERNEFAVHYQPKISLATGKIVGFEALARWEHPERGLLHPDQFVPVAEETGLIVPIGEAVLEEACRQAKEWHEQRPTDAPAMCVNLSARQFREPGLTQSVARILDETGLDPSSLFLEVTESTAMRDALATAAALEDLQNLGVRTILDDFGTGYSSLSYLERFPVEYIKIDRSFVGGLGQHPGAEMLVSAIISLAHALGLKVIAEGVETEKQCELLRGMGCDLAQGHLFSEPLTAKEVQIF